MEKIIVIQFFLIGSIAALYGQMPQAFKYQAVIRKDNLVISNQLISIKTSILKDSPSGIALFSQIDTVTANSAGIVNLAVGNSGIDSGTIQNIDWSSGIYFLKTELDETGV
jgi:hypothetical protein